MADVEHRNRPEAFPETALAGVWSMTDRPVGRLPCSRRRCRAVQDGGGPN